MAISNLWEAFIAYYHAYLRLGCVVIVCYCFFELFFYILWTIMLARSGLFYYITLHYISISCFRRREITSVLNVLAYILVSPTIAICKFRYRQPSLQENSIMYKKRQSTYLITENRADIQMLLLLRLYSNKPNLLVRSRIHARNRCFGDYAI